MCGLILTFLSSFLYLWQPDRIFSMWFVSSLFTCFHLFHCQEFIPSIKPEQEQINKHVSRVSVAVGDITVFAECKESVKYWQRWSFGGHHQSGVKHMGGNASHTLPLKYFYFAHEEKLMNNCCGDEVKGFQSCHSQRMWANVVPRDKSCQRMEHIGDIKVRKRHRPKMASVWTSGCVSAPVLSLLPQTCQKFPHIWRDCLSSLWSHNWPFVWLQFEHLRLFF